MGKSTLVMAVCLLLFSPNAHTQSENPYVAYNVPFQNLMKFNRFLINPTFSTVREDKTYLNFFHRSQGSDFQDNAQNYFLSYSAVLNNRTGLGLSVYNQQSGVISNVGVMGNYAHGIRLGKNTDLSFGFNLPYYKSSFDESRAVALQEDPLLDDLEDSSIISFQPGLNLSLGRFDVGVFAQNLFDFNLKSGEMLSEVNGKTFSGHLQYAHEFKNGRGIFEDGRLMPLARARFEGSQEPIFGGGLILDLPKLGWIQGGYDQYYGASAGTGFNLNKRLSFGYNFEKGFNNSLNNLGVTHEISVAYSFVPNLTKNLYVAEENDKRLVQIVEETGQEDKPGKADADLTPLEEELAKIKEQQRMNLAIIDELIFRLDSMETNRQRDLEQRFEMVMRMVRKENHDNKPDIEKKAQELFLTKNVKAATFKNDIASITRATRKTEKQTGVFTGGAFKPIEKYIKLDGIGKGHYLIVNVFGNENYLHRFIKELKTKGLNPKYFKNPENGLNYVYLAHFDDDMAARSAYGSQLNGKYNQDMWIMHVENPRYSNYAETLFDDE
tara:strand:- start:11381 stop:13036 length:1656 start_codon:yes stop_codon:yes gene_type:complete